MEKYKDFQPKLTYALMSIYIIVYLAELYISYAAGYSGMRNLFLDYGFSLKGIMDGKWWTFFTSIFLHAGAEHLILNMIALYFFGKVVEEKVGPKKFSMIFLISAIFGCIAVLLASILGLMPSNIPTVGASGAIFGLMGAAMLIGPFEFIFYPYLIPVPLILVAVIYTLYNVAAFVTVLLTGAETEIAYIAHIGGLLVGAAFGFKEEGIKRGLLIIILIISIMVAIPFFWYLIEYLEVFNYIAMFGK